jgi:hypothetical protein
MSKINGAERTSNHSALRALADSGLDAVTGGTEFVITKLSDVSVSSGGGDGGGGPGGAISAWNQLLKNYGYIR